MRHLIDYRDAAAVRAKIKELQEDLWLYDHSNPSRWECEKQIVELEAWLEDLEEVLNNPI